MINCGLRIADCGFSDCAGLGGPFLAVRARLCRAVTRLQTHEMPPEPGPQRFLIDRQGLGVMKMAAGPVLRGAAGMEDMRSFPGGRLVTSCSLNAVVGSAGISRQSAIGLDLSFPQNSP